MKVSTVQAYSNLVYAQVLSLGGLGGLNPCNMRKTEQAIMNEEATSELILKLIFFPLFSSCFYISTRGILLRSSFHLNIQSGSFFN